MKKATLRSVGLAAGSDIPADELFSPSFCPGDYGLSENDSERISVLREFLTEYNQERPLETGISITGPSCAAGMMYPVMRTLDHEELWCMYLNGANVPLKKKKIATGVLDYVPMDIRNIVLTALENKARGIILFHNHPSGRPTPSGADVKVTDNARQALKLFDINLLDHIIMGKSSYYSFDNEMEMDIKAAY